MNVQELMVGDWVLVRMNHTTDKYKEGDYLPHKVVVQRDWRKETNEIELITIQNNSEQDDFVKPIPLTSDILEKNAFQLFAGVWYFRGWKDKPISIVFKDNGIIALSLNCDPIPMNLKYVHQLQHALRICGIKKEIEL